MKSERIAFIYVRYETELNVLGGVVVNTSVKVAYGKWNEVLKYKVQSSVNE